MSDLPKPRMTFVLWTVCVIAAIGFAFDIYELLMLPLIAGDAMRELGPYLPGSPEFIRWRGLLFYVPALFGGAFGLIGGYLTDRYGRRRVLTWSILLYAVSAFLAGFSTSMPMLLFFRTTTFIGVCVEFVAAVAWLAELFDHPVQREKALGYTQAFSSIGGLLVAVINGVIVMNRESLPAIQIPAFLTTLIGSIAPEHQHETWRYTLMSGILPAIPLIIIRPFLPESPKWVAKKAAGTLRRPSVLDLFRSQFRRVTIVTTLMFACSYGVAFGALQLVPEIVGGIDKVQENVAAATKDLPPTQAKQKAASIVQSSRANYTKAQELGGLFGRFALAMIVAHVASRRRLLRIFLIPSLFVLPLVFWGFYQLKETVFFTFDMSWLPGFHHVSVTLLGIGIFLAGFFTVAQFSFWGNYLPHAYPVHLRGTGESVAANIGGRMMGTPFAWVTPQLAALAFVPGESTFSKNAAAAAIVAFTLIALNLALSFVLPEQSADAPE